MKNKILVFALTLFLSCNISQKNSNTVNVNSNYDTLVFTMVTVVDKRDLDGCSFLLMKRDSTFLNPLNLDSKFAINGKHLAIKYHNIKGGVGICMAGYLVALDEINELEK